MNRPPIIPPIVEAYAFVFGKLGRVIGLIWLPALLLTVAGYFALLPFLRLLASNPSLDDIVQHNGIVLGFYGFLFLFLFLLAAIMTALTREVMAPGGENARFGFPPLGLVFRVFLGYVGLLLIVLVSVMVSDMLARLADAPILSAVGRVAALIYFFLRPGFLLVPAAIEGGKSGVAQSWRQSAGNFWRLAAIAAATTLPVLLVAEIAGVLIVGSDNIPVQGSTADAAKVQSEYFALQADNFPALMCVNFLLMPLGCGLPAAAAAFFHRALNAKTD